MNRSLRAAAVMPPALAVAVSMTMAIPAALAAPAAKPLTSKTFAGYEVTKTKTHITSATTTFVVPTITCKKNFSGVGPSIVVETTPNKKNIYVSDVAAVGVGCEHKQPAYESIIQVNNHSYNDFPFAAGDKVTVTISLNNSKTTVTVDDVTSGAHKTRTGAGHEGEYAYFGDEGLEINSKKTGLDPFSKTSFTGSEINHKSLAAEKAVAYERKRGATLQIAVSKLSAGKDFNLTFEHS